MTMITITLSKPILEDVLEAIKKKEASYRSLNNYTKIGLQVAIDEIEQAMAQAKMAKDVQGKDIKLK